MRDNLLSEAFDQNSPQDMTELSIELYNRLQPNETRVADQILEMFSSKKNGVNIFTKNYFLKLSFDYISE